MEEAQKNNSFEKLSPEDAFKRTRSDAAHTGAKLALSTLPLAGEIFELFIAAPASKRRDAFLITVYEVLKELRENTRILVSSRLPRMKCSRQLLY